MDNQLKAEKMNTEEMVAIVTGADFWQTARLEAAGIPSVFMADGPNGLRKQTGATDMLGLNESVPATCFPSSSTTACSFDRELLYDIGKALGEECVASGVGVLLGPGINIKRDPRCGRSFEYLSEDPLLAGKLAAAYINGVQSQNVAATVKHFLANSQETERMVSDSIIDERALREIYALPFEIAVKESDPRAVMCAYNKVNGEYVADSKSLLTDLLRKEWGFNGMVVSDWGATDDKVAGIKAGLDLEMPANGTAAGVIKKALKSGELTTEELAQSAARVAKLALTCNEKPRPCNMNLHHKLAGRAAAESAVLLENNGALPLAAGTKAAVIGSYAQALLQGTGSASVNPYRTNTFCEALSEEGISFSYARGINEKGETTEALLSEARTCCEGADVIILCAGPDESSGEGADRTDINLPAVYNTLVDELLKSGKPLIVTVYGVTMLIPFAKKVSAVLLCGLGGQNVGSAVVDLLYGKVSPSGRLAESIPEKPSDIPCFNYFAVPGRKAEYRESVLVGYRYYDKANKNIYPFGYGLSYTTFEYSDLLLSKNSYREGEELFVRFKVRNTGKVAAKEVCQLYLAPPASDLFRPLRELKEFCKVSLEPNETKTVTMRLSTRAFAYFNAQLHGWRVETGIYTVEIGRNCRDICLSRQVQVFSAQNAIAEDYSAVAPCYYNPPAVGAFEVPDKQFEAVLGKQLTVKKTGELTLNSTFGELRASGRGAFVYRYAVRQMATVFGNGGEAMMKAMLNDMPLRVLRMCRGNMGEKAIGIVRIANGQPIKGLAILLRR